MDIRYTALKNKILFSLLIATGILMLYSISIINYLLFHCIAEFASIAIALSLFLIAWNLKERTENSSLVYLGIAYFFVSILDLAHTLSYKGMNIFEYEYYASDLWIAARYMQSISLLLFFFFPKARKSIFHETVFGIYFCITATLMTSIYYWKIFPVCFIEGIGQTDFKIYSEYIICGILILSLLPLHHNRKFFDRTIFKLLCWSVIFTIASEFSFSLYKDVYAFPNFLGHIFKLISFYLIYKAIIENSLKQPFNLIFKELKEKEELLNMTQKIAKIGGWDYNPAADKITWTDEVYNIRDLPPGYQADLGKALSFYTEASARKVRETFEKLMKEGGSDDLELEMITAANRKIWVRVTFVAEQENGKTARVTGIIQDITENKKMQKLREDFERIARHDLKTPLNSIFMISQLLENKELTKTENKKIAQIIQESVHNLLDMINLSLNLYKMEEGAYKLSSVPLNLKALLKRVVHDQHLSMKSKKIALLFTANGKPVDEDSSVFEMNGEEILLYSMFSNLYKNAIEASGADDKIEINLEDIDGKYRVEIKNKAVVPPELRDKFFDKYTTSGKRGGTGLGTYSAKLIAELHKGRVSMISSDGLGTSVIIELPK